MALPHVLAASTLVLLLTATARPADDTQPLDIGARRELLVDRYLIDTMHDVRLVLHTPRDEGIVVRFDQPWEGPFCGYCTVIQDGPLYRLYYRGLPTAGRDGSAAEVCCYAESADGLHWTKPDLGLFELVGTTHNNVVLANAAPVTHNFCPLLDTRPGVSLDERYKAVGGVGDKLFAFISPDGMHWKKMQDEPILSKADVPFPHVHLFDSQNLAFWSESEQTYVCYFRVWDGLRKIARATSSDFRKWSPAVLMQQVYDDGVSGPQPAPAEHLYTNQTSPYFRAPHIYIATAARFFEGRQVLSKQQAKAINVNPDFFKDTSDSVFMSSRGGQVYDRTFLEGHLKPGIGANNWVSRTNYPALNVVQTGPTEMSFYVNQDYAQPTAHLRRYSLRLDGFASAQADYAAGELLTRPLVFQGRELSINFATSAAGGIRVELQRADGTPIPGFTRGDAVEQIGNEIQRVVSWTGGSDVSTLAGQSIRICLVMHDADLFAIQFRDE